LKTIRHDNIGRTRDYMGSKGAQRYQKARYHEKILKWVTKKNCVLRRKIEKQYERNLNVKGLLTSFPLAFGVLRNEVACLSPSALSLSRRVQRRSSG